MVLLKFRSQVKQQIISFRMIALVSPVQSSTELIRAEALHKFESKILKMKSTG